MFARTFRTVPASKRGARYWFLQVALVTLAVAAVSVTGAEARADEDEWQVSGRFGLGGASVDGRTPLGLALGFDLKYGIDDAWAARVSASGARQGADADSRLALPAGSIWSYGAFAGLTYTMDVLRLLPIFDVGVGMLGVAGAVKQSRRALGIQVGLGAEYLLTPRWTVGAMAEYIFAPFDLVSNALNGSQTPQWFSLCARLGWIWN